MQSLSNIRHKVKIEYYIATVIAKKRYRLTKMNGEGKKKDSWKCKTLNKPMNAMKIIMILWNHSYSLGTIFVYWFEGTCFVGNWFVALQCKTINYIVKSSWGRKFIGNGTCNSRNPRTLNLLCPQYYRKMWLYEICTRQNSTMELKSI